jgi:hypothetical protein
MLCEACSTSIPEIVFNVYLTAEHNNQFCKGTGPIPFAWRLMRLISSDIGFCVCGICLTHHPSSRASHLSDSSHAIAHSPSACDYFIFQNRNMEPQHHRVIHFSWHMVGFYRVEFPEYVLYPHLFSLPSHISCLCL